jgi:fumarate hydratase subunit alpha
MRSRREESPWAGRCSKKIIDNAELPAAKKWPHLSGYRSGAVLFMNLGQDVPYYRRRFAAAIEEGVRQAYQDGFLRKIRL